MKKFIVQVMMFMYMINQGMVAYAEEQEENPLKLEELTVQVLPEYSYHPKDEEKEGIPLLVGYHGSFMNVSEQPVKGIIEIPLPVHEQNFRIGFVADYSADLREMYEIEYVLDEQKGTISWETSRDIEPQEMYKFVIEYYTNISHSGKTRELDYEFTSFAEIGLFNLIFVEPLKTDSFKLTPQAETHQKNTFNMNMFLYQQANMQPGDVKNIHLEYEREDDRLTIEILEDMAGSDEHMQQVTKTNDEKIPLGKIIVIIGSVTIILGGLMIFFLKKHSKRNKMAETVERKDSLEVKKAKLRTMLLEGSITEEEYQQLLKSIGGDKK